MLRINTLKITMELFFFEKSLYLRLIEHRKRTVTLYQNYGSSLAEREGFAFLRKSRSRFWQSTGLSFIAAPSNPFNQSIKKNTIRSAYLLHEGFAFLRKSRSQFWQSTGLSFITAPSNPFNQNIKKEHLAGVLFLWRITCIIIKISC